MAGSCVFSGWFTLIFSVILAVLAFGAGATAATTAARAKASSNYFPSPPTTPGSATSLPGLGEDMDILGGSRTPGPMMVFELLQGALPGVCFASGVITLVTGIVGFILFLGVAQACYALLDLDEQTYEISQTLNAIVARLGAGGAVPR